MYEFDPRNFRNDIAFSIANHIINGFKEVDTHLPSPLFFTDTDTILSVDADQILINVVTNSKNVIIPIAGHDIHFLNKKNILDNYQSLWELACLDT